MLYRAHDKCSLLGVEGIFFNPYVKRERRPLSTPSEIHEIANRWFEDRFGIAFRSRAVFCSGSQPLVAGFMTEDKCLISIRPVGDYKLCYSGFCEDFTPHFSLVRDYSHCDLRQAVLEELDLLCYVYMENEGLELAASSGCEVMLFAEAFRYQVVG